MNPVIKQMCLLEHDKLREELANLKKCQVTFITTAVTATGAIFGLLGLDFIVDYREYIALVPLVILLPFWMMFFDKAMTITRIVGYYRVIEGLLLERTTADEFIGWENALGKYRKEKSKIKKAISEDDREESIAREKTNLRSKSYWLLVYLIFLFLSIICLWISFSIGINGENGGIDRYHTLLIFSTVLVAFVAVLNFIAYIQLTRGAHSYTFTQAIWNRILKVH